MPSRKAVRDDDARLEKNRQKAGKSTSTTKPKRVKVTINPRMQDLMDGKLSMEDLDDEEIQKGMLRNEKGNFTGSSTQMVPRKFHNALVAETIKRMEGKFREDLELAQRVLREIANNPRASADARYKSAVYLTERVMGKIPEKQIVEASIKHWEEGLEDIIIDFESGFESTGTDGSSFPDNVSPIRKQAAKAPARKRTAKKP